MTVVAVVVALVTAVAHRDRVMFFWDDDFMVLVELDKQRFAFFVAGVAIETGNVFLESDKVGVGLANRRGVEEVCINEGVADDGLGPAPKIRSKGAREGKEYDLAR
jgi:hypothetical protein